jgi:hypothetical protein
MTKTIRLLENIILSIFLDFMDDGMTLYVTTDITDRVLHGALWSIMADIIWNR